MYEENIYGQILLNQDQVVKFLQLTMQRLCLLENVQLTMVVQGRVFCGITTK